MKKALIFPGQGSQQPGMGKDLFEKNEQARRRFAQAAEILGFDIAPIMFEGTKEDLTQTSVTQPAIFLHSVLLAETLNLAATAAMTAGHSLGEFSALVVAGCLTFEDGLLLVRERANAMQAACNLTPSTMAAIIGLEDYDVEVLCAKIDALVVPANYNSPGQIVVSGSIEGVQQAIAVAKERGARMAVQLPVNGAFHSPLMQPAREQLARAIESVSLQSPHFPIYQNITAKGETDPGVIRENLNLQLTSPVRWTQTILNMADAGAELFVEVGPGAVLKGLCKKIVPTVSAESISTLPA